MTFALGTFAKAGATFVGLVADEAILPLAELDARWRRTGRAGLCDCATVLGLLEDWDASFEILRALAAFAVESGVEAIDRGDVRFRPPVLRPGKILHAAANYVEHVKEMAAYNVASGTDPHRRFTGRKDGASPYLFLKASSALIGAYDDIVLPEGEHQIDWEAELAVAIGRGGRRIRARDAMDHVAGFMVTNDVSCRDRLWRPDRPNFKTDWLASKSFDGFAPMGPLFVPRAFVPDPSDLRIELRVNGQVKQQGGTAEMIFSTEEQIEYAAAFMTLEPGDIFVTGTIGGVGQATGEYLQAGDWLETGIAGVGEMRNRIVAAA